MTERDYWELFEVTGNISDYLSYRRSLAASSRIEEDNNDETDDRGFGDLGKQDRRGGSGDYPFNA